MSHAAQIATEFRSPEKRPNYPQSRRWLWRLVERSRCAAQGCGHFEEDVRFSGDDEEVGRENKD
jgi:hypothetical protein